MSPVDRRGAPPRLLLVAALLLVALGAVPAPATAAADPWTASRVRFEPLDPTHHLSVDGTGSYRGAIEVARGPSGLGVVNDVALDDYVAGLSEVPNSWPAEALEAQAIAGRTYALWQKGRRVTTEWRALGADICATQDCQVYTGLRKERSDRGERWVDAVRATTGQVLLWDGQPIKAMYSSSNGGWSVPGGQPYLPSVHDPDDAHSPLHRWEASYPLSDVQAVWQLPGPVVHVGRAGGLVGIYFRDPHTGEDRSHVVEMQAFRTAFNAAAAAPPGLPLAIPGRRFDVATEDGRLLVTGGGYGHGIGMSQWGAFGKAMRGWTAEQILAAYSGGVVPQTLPAEAQPSTVKVAVATGRPAITVRSAGPFRVLGDDGRPLAVVASGTWRVLPAPGGVRVAPPTGQAGPLALAVPRADPNPMVEGRPSELAVVIAVPAHVRVTVSPPGEEPQVVVDGIQPAGTVAVALPPATDTGVYRAHVVADAGAGRQAETTAELMVLDPSDPQARRSTLDTATLSRTTPVRPRLGADDERGPGMMAAAVLFVLGAALVPLAWKLRDS